MLWRRMPAHRPSEVRRGKRGRVSRGVLGRGPGVRRRGPGHSLLDRHAARGARRAYRALHRTQQGT